MKEDMSGIERDTSTRIQDGGIGMEADPNTASILSPDQ
jgi:hypothetical protein